MTKRAIRLGIAAIFVWSCAMSMVFAWATGADIGSDNIGFILLDGAVMFVLGSIIPGLVYLMFRHRIENPAALFGLWATVIVFVGLGNFVAWILI